MPASAAQPSRYTFGDFTLDTGRGALLTHDREIRLRPQSFAVLSILVARHGRLVSKDELHREVWGNKVVTDDSLAQCVIDIRKAIGDAERKIIRTVPRRGYIFDAAVVVAPEYAANNEGTASWVNRNRVLAATAVAAAALVCYWLLESGAQQGDSAPSPRSIAVLPFVDMSAAQDQQYLGDGLSEDLLNSLAAHSDLRVIARTSSFSFRDQTPDIATIRDALNVAYVVEGSVRRVKGRLKVIAQLIDTADSSHVWTQSFELLPDELFAVQQSIAGRILEELLPNDERTADVAATRHVSANESMLLARHYELEVREQPEVDEDMLAESIDLYRAATQADPKSALAHSRLAGALLYAGAQNAAEAPIFRALTLDPNLSEVQETLGKYYWLRGLPGAGAAWKRAVELNGNNADALSGLAFWTWHQGDDESPEELFRRALQLDPLSLSRYAALGNYYGHMARVDDALSTVSQIERHFDVPEAYRLIARILELIGRSDESIAWIIRARDLEPDNDAHTAALAEIYADIGDIETALSLNPDPDFGLLLRLRRYAEAVEVGEWLMIEEPGDISLRYWLAFAYNVTGRAEDAVRILETTGLPDTMFHETRQAIDVEAFVTLIDALDASGRVQRSRELADFFLNNPHTQSRNWWIHFYQACTLATVNRHDEALSRLERVTNSPRLPWHFLLRDARCLQQYADHPRYRAVLDSVDARRAALTSRVPATLEEFGVAR